MWKRYAFVAAMAAGIVPLAAGPASATSSLYIYTNGTVAGHGHFNSAGDIWKACDDKTDGYGVEVDWYVVPTGRTGAVRDSSGNDGVCAVQDVNIGEGNEVGYRVCLVSGDAYIACTGWYYDYA